MLSICLKTTKFDWLCLVVKEKGHLVYYLDHAPLLLESLIKIIFISCTSESSRINQDHVEELVSISSKGSQGNREEMEAGDSTSEIRD